MVCIISDNDVEINEDVDEGFIFDGRLSEDVDVSSRVFNDDVADDGFDRDMDEMGEEVNSQEYSFKEGQNISDYEDSRSDDYEDVLIDEDIETSEQEIIFEKNSEATCYSHPNVRQDGDQTLWTYSHLSHVQGVDTAERRCEARKSSRSSQLPGQINFKRKK